MSICKKHDTVTAYIFSPDFTRILMVKKRFSSRLMPPGGHVEKGEAFIDAAFREVYEETGVEPTGLTKIHFDRRLPDGHPDYTVSAPTQDEEFVVTERVNDRHYHIDHIYCFRLSCDALPKPPRSIEIARVEWLAVSDIRREDFYPNVFDTIAFFRKG
jgi:8-oxo-dGTP pyrophosphatase MutT (NUDIX family)